jgi:hypothetical protein
MTDDFETDRLAGARFERAVFWRLLLIAAVIAAVVVLRAIYG